MQATLACDRCCANCQRMRPFLPLAGFGLAISIAARLAAQPLAPTTERVAELRALSEVNVNFGLLLLLPKTDEMGNRRMWINSVNPLRTGALPKGQLEVRWFSIERAQ